MRATARPWLPSVAHASVLAPGRSCSARWIAHDAPSTLNEGSPSRPDSSLTITRRTERGRRPPARRPAASGRTREACGTRRAGRRRAEADRPGEPVADEPLGHAVSAAARTAYPRAPASSSSEMCSSTRGERLVARPVADRRDAQCSGAASVGAEHPVAGLGAERVDRGAGEAHPRPRTRPARSSAPPRARPCRRRTGRGRSRPGRRLRAARPPRRQLSAAARARAPRSPGRVRRSKVTVQRSGSTDSAGYGRLITSVGTRIACPSAGCDGSSSARAARRTSAIASTALTPRSGRDECEGLVDLHHQLGAAALADHHAA